MRTKVILLGCVALAACKGAGPQTISAAPPPTGTPHSFVKPNEKKTYNAIGGMQSYTYYTRSDSTQQAGQLYQGSATTARNSGITVAYDPRDAVFEVTIKDSAGGIDQMLRFQDPAHRTDFGGLDGPQPGTPQFADNKQVMYLQSGNRSGEFPPSSVVSDLPVGDPESTSDVRTFFFQKPGTKTRFVTFAGFVRNQVNAVLVEPENQPSYIRRNYDLDRAILAYGERTSESAVPKTGSATYSGDMIATMVYNPRFDTSMDASTYIQWIEGSASTNVTFADSRFTSSFTGTVKGIQRDAYTTGIHDMPAGATFSATGSGSIDMMRTGGLKGEVSTASFTNGGTVTAVNIAGSSIDAAFFGPGAEEVGGGFRVVGGTPDERIDILGTFTGAKP